MVNESAKREAVEAMLPAWVRIARANGHEPTEAEIESLRRTITDNIECPADGAEVTP